ncbi:MAG: hypothetical protein Q8M24_13440 [Pseudolabrys sp.]|nr:hypothetical protein [Pseudolabrys sp.]MDP2296446.1 hypothetical protein [Pseudolabrys sp.]
MTTAAKKFHVALTAVALAFVVLSAPAAFAEPMKCSGEEKACLVACKKTARVAVNICLTGCGARLSACLKSGCWDTGTQRYCSLAKS